MHRSIVGIDMENSTARMNPIKEMLRDQAYRMLHESMNHAGIDEHRCDPFEDRGDGVLVLIRPDDELPKTLLLARLVPVLTQQLVDYNLAVPAPERPRLGLRLRAVIHAGEVHRDGNGCFGEALDLAFRLLDAPALKKCLQLARSPLVLVVSEDIYRGIVKHGYDGISPQRYHPAVRVSVAGRRHRGYVNIPAEVSTIPNGPVPAHVG